MTFQVEISCQTSRYISGQRTQESQLYSKDWYIVHYFHSLRWSHPFMQPYCVKQVERYHAELQKIRSLASVRRFG